MMMLDETEHQIKAAQMIREHEGWRASVYTDASGHPTIGYGFRLDMPEALPKWLGTIWLHNRIYEIDEELANQIASYSNQPKLIKSVLIDMAYNLGVNGLLSFKKMLEALNEGRYAKAAKEIMNSNWAHQVPTRAKDDAFIVESYEVK